MDDVLLLKTNYGLKVTANSAPSRVVIKAEFEGKVEYKYPEFGTATSVLLDYTSDTWKLGSLKAYLFPIDPVLYKALRQGEHASPPKGKPTERSLYAIPSKYAFPINDAAHVRAAEDYFNRHKFADHSERQFAARRIMRAARKFGIDISPQSVVARAAKGDHVIEKTIPWAKACFEPFYLPSCVQCGGPLAKEGATTYYCFNCEIRYEIE